MISIYLATGDVNRARVLLLLQLSRKHFMRSNHLTKTRVFIDLGYYWLTTTVVGSPSKRSRLCYSSRAEKVHPNISVFNCVGKH